MERAFSEMPIELARRFGRRRFLKAAGGAIALAAGMGSLGQICRAAEKVAASWPKTVKFPGKVDLILNVDRPPNLETPLRFYREDLTPNDAFYVRWHLAGLPTRIDTKTFRLSIGGHVEKSQKLSLDDLKTQFEPTSLVAVNQCSGNSRSKFDPRVPGVQWGNGAMGNAKWTGVRLRDLLGKTNVQPGAVDVSFDGLDEPILKSAPGYQGTPDFVKSLAFDHANDGEVMVAYAMNDQPLPMLNGFPLRLIVPGWYGTYWVKALSEITVLDKKFDGFWMAKAYRVPNTVDFQETPDALAKDTVPISRMTTRSLFVRPEPEETVPAGADFEVQGIAMDGGAGIQKVELSTDGGKTWLETKLDPSLGNYSWRRWRYNWRPTPGKFTLRVRATNNAGETQIEHQWNRSGYARKVIESMDVTVA